MTKLKVEYTTAEAAKLIGIHRNTVLAWIRRGELRARRRGRDYRIPLVALRDSADLWESILMRQRLAR